MEESVCAEDILQVSKHNEKYITSSELQRLYALLNCTRPSWQILHEFRANSAITTFSYSFSGGGREANENIPKCATTNFEKLGSRGQCWLEAAFQSYAEQWKAGREPRTQVKGEVSSRRSQPNQVRILWLSHAEGVRVRRPVWLTLPVESKGHDGSSSQA